MPRTVSRWRSSARDSRSASSATDALVHLHGSILTAAAWFEPEGMEHRRVVFGLGIWSGQQFFADEERIGAGHKTQRDRFARKRAAPRAQANHRSRHQDSRRRNRAHKDQRIERVQMFERSPGDAHQRIDGHAFRMRIERGKLVQQADAIVLPIRPGR